MCLKAFHVPPHIRASLTAMLPPNMRAGLKHVTLPANPLRQTPTPQSAPVFALPESEKIFGAMKPAKKSEEIVVVEKVEVRISVMMVITSSYFC